MQGEEEEEEEEEEDLEEEEEEVDFVAFAEPTKWPRTDHLSLCHRLEAGWPSKQGAEATICSCDLFGKPVITKEQFPKTYQVPEQDRKLTQRRMGQEVCSMPRWRMGPCSVPHGPGEKADHHGAGD